MRPVSGRRFCQVLEKHGWVLRRVRGSHHIYAKAGTAAIITVPMHGNRDLKAGTQRTMMRQADLTDDDL